MPTVPNPFLTRGNKADKGAPGRKAEKNMAKRLGGKLRPGSGAIKGAKGDVVLKDPSRPDVPDFLMENKSSQGDSFSVKKEWLRKIYKEARNANSQPALAFQFVSGNGDSSVQDRWVCIPEGLFHELFD